MYSTYVEKCNKLLMDIDFDLFSYCLGEFMKCSAGVYTFLFISKIHPNAKIRDQNLISSKDVTLLCKVYMTLTYPAVPNNVHKELSPAKPT